MKARFPIAIVLVTIIACLSSPHVAQAAYLGNVSFDKADRSFLDHDTDVNITIDYKIDTPNGALIYARPYTLGSTTPGYAASGSPVHPMGIGTATQYFRITTGNHQVTHVRVYMRDASTLEVLLEIFIPVRWVWGDCGVFHAQMSHNQHDRLRHGTDLEIDFDYGTNYPGNLRIFARPYTDGALTPGYSASGSISLPPSGSYSQHFSFANDADVTDIRFQVYNEDQSELLASTLMISFPGATTSGFLKPSMVMSLAEKVGM